MLRAVALADPVLDHRTEQRLLDTVVAVTEVRILPTAASSLAHDPRVLDVEVPGARLHVEVRGRGPTVVLHGAPMPAAAFTGLADELASDHTVVTIDPRGIARSSVEDRDAEVSPDARATDVAATMEHLGLAPGVVVGSSGGAVSALSLAASRPDLVTAAVAHEPPVAQVLDDRDQVRRDTEEMVATYLAGDRVGYWRRFLASAGIDLPVASFDAWFAQPPVGRDAEDEWFAVARMELATTLWPPPVDELRACGVPISIGVGADSSGQLCDRTSRAVAELLDLEVTVFPGDHTGFVDDPSGFAAVLRQVIGDEAR